MEEREKLIKFFRWLENNTYGSTMPIEGIVDKYLSSSQQLVDNSNKDNVVEQPPIQSEGKSKGKYYYFIENEKGEWHYIDKRKRDDDFGLDQTLYNYNEWTTDPMKAARFETKEQAEYQKRMAWELKEHKNLEVTEHEFVINPSKQSDVVEQGEEKKCEHEWDYNKYFSVKYCHKCGAKYLV